MKYKVTLNDTTYEVEVEKGEAILVDQYAAAAAPVAAPVAAVAVPVAVPAAVAPATAPVAGADDVVAPMPGTVLGVKVKVGDAVKKGQLLLILEAMKMENEIVAPTDGIVGAIAVNQGQSVDTGAVLVVFGTPGAVAAPAPVAAAPAPVAAPATAPVEAATPAAITSGEIVSAPMPGTILGVKIKVGDAVKKGQLLLILEAMKMENEIVAPCDGVVAQIAVSQGQTVDTGAALLSLN